MLWETNHFVLLVIFLICALGVLEASFRAGLRSRASSDKDDQMHFAALQGAVLVLLSLLLGFTFAMAVERFDSRKQLVVDEANAIETTFLRSKFLPPAQRDAAPKLLREYVETRIEFDHILGMDMVRFDKVNGESARVAQQIWSLAVDAAAQNPSSETTQLFIESLNEAIDIREQRMVALEDHVPEAIIYLLLIVWFGAIGLLAFGCGLDGKRRFGSNAVFAFLFALVLTIILDVDRPRRGLIKISKASMLRLKASLDKASDQSSNGSAAPSTDNRPQEPTNERQR